MSERDELVQFAANWRHEPKTRAGFLARGVLDLAADVEVLRAGLREACDIASEPTARMGIDGKLGGPDRAGQLARIDAIRKEHGL